MAMNRDKKVLLTFIVAMLGAIVFAAAQNLFYEIWNFQFNLGLLNWQRLFYPKNSFLNEAGNPLDFLGTIEFVCEILGLLFAGVCTSWPIYLGIRKFIWKR